MNDIFGKIVAPFLVVLGLIIVPIMNIALKADEAAQLIIDNAVYEFVDNTRASGKITVSEYEKFVNTVNATQALCDIHITYGEYVSVPTGLKPDGTYDYYGYYDECNEFQILDTLYTDVVENKDFYMQKGSYIKVTVNSTAPSLGAKMLSLFVPTAATNKNIVSSYGGYVGQSGIMNY